MMADTYDAGGRRELEFWRSIGEQEDPSAAVTGNATPEETEATIAAVLAGIAEVVSERQPIDRRRVLELGCGQGRLLLPLAERYPDHTFIGIDIAPKLLLRLPWTPNVHAFGSDGANLPQMLGSGAIDAAYSVAVFQHNPAEIVRGYIGQVGERLRPGGVFRFQFVEGNQAEFLGHHFDTATVGEWCHEAGLEVESVEHWLVHDNWTWITAKKP